MVEDTGTAYGRSRPTYNGRLVEVGPGTPCGEFLRRYWHPVGLSTEAGGRPRVVKVLGEALVLFRDGTGRPGLVYPRCCHRGTTLYYGRIEDRGIRCCYHGWLFDVEGRCLEQPCEPGGGEKRQHYRQPWYPVREQYGLVFAYLGPPDRRPALPRYDVLEELDEGEFLDADGTSLGSGGVGVVPCNWLQHFENVMDPLHVPILHGSFSGVQFVEQMGRVPEVSFAATARGVRSVQDRSLDEGGRFRRITEVVMPTLRVVPSPRLASFGRASSVGWVLPLDDTSFVIYVVGRVRELGELADMRSRFGGRLWSELSEEEHQQMPGDWEAQVGQGAITWHSEEHLVSSDRGVSMVRRVLREQIEIVRTGGDPMGVTLADDAPVVRLEAGNYLPE